MYIKYVYVLMSCGLRKPSNFNMTADLRKVTQRNRGKRRLAQHQASGSKRNLRHAMSRHQTDKETRATVHCT